MDRRAERVQILTFLQQIGGDQHKRIAGHSKLPYQRLIHLTRHAANGLLLWMSAIERRAIAAGVSLPAGGSLLAIAERPA